MVPADLRADGGAQDPLLTGAGLHEMWTPDLGGTTRAKSWALGTRNGRHYRSHGGSQEKAWTELRIYPDERLCIVAMTNTRASSDSSFTNRTDNIVLAVDDLLQMCRNQGQPQMQP